MSDQHSELDVGRYFSADEVLKTWPSPKKRQVQLAVLKRLGGLFEVGREYSEPEVNEILRAHLAFSDYVLVRRELIEAGVLGRTRDGRRYWRETPSGPAQLAAKT